MTIHTALLPQELLTARDEQDLARCIEAGLYANHLLTQEDHRHSREELIDVVEAARRARDRLWLCNIRLVLMLASAAARRHELGIDDLFQEGCLALHEAIMRFDHALGMRLSTLAHTYVTRRLSRVTAMRAGSAHGPGNRNRRLSRLAATRMHVQRDEELSLRELAQRAGLSHTVAARATILTVSLDDVDPRYYGVDDDYDEVCGVGSDFLNLLGFDGQYLRLRFGIGTRAHSRAELEQRLGMSSSTVARLENRALERARSLLEADQCRVAAPHLLGAAS